MILYIETMGVNDKLSLQDLSYKVVMLLALTRPSRSADLAGLDLRFRRYLPEGVSFAPTMLAKQTKQDKAMADFFFPAFPHNVNLCPVETLRAYEKCTEAFREQTSKLFIATIKPHQPVSSSTIARWLKTMLSNVNTDTFKAHSVRSASVTAAAKVVQMSSGPFTCEWHIGHLSSTHNSVYT